MNTYIYTLRRHPFWSSKTRRNPRGEVAHSSARVNGSLWPCWTSESSNPTVCLECQKVVSIFAHPSVNVSLSRLFLHFQYPNHTSTLCFKGVRKSRMLYRIMWVCRVSDTRCSTAWCRLHHILSIFAHPIWCLYSHTLYGVYIRTP